MEGFWSLVKRGIGGVYHSVSAKHLQAVRAAALAPPVYELSLGSEAR